MLKKHFGFIVFAFVFFANPQPLHANIVGKLWRHCGAKIQQGLANIKSPDPDLENALQAFGITKKYEASDGVTSPLRKLPKIKERLRLAEGMSKIAVPENLKLEDLEGLLRQNLIPLPESPAHPRQRGPLSSGFHSENEAKATLDFIPEIVLAKGRARRNEVSLRFNSLTKELIVKKEFDFANDVMVESSIQYNLSKISLPRNSVVGEFYPVPEHSEYIFQDIGRNEYRILRSEDLSKAKEAYKANAAEYTKALQERIQAEINEKNPELLYDLALEAAHKVVAESDPKHHLNSTNRDHRAVQLAEDYMTKNNPHALYQRLVRLQDYTNKAGLNYSIAAGPTHGSLRVILMQTSGSIDFTESLSRILGVDSSQYEVTQLFKRDYIQGKPIFFPLVAHFVLVPK